jgi:hypothetical protein
MLRSFMDEGQGYSGLLKGLVPRVVVAKNLKTYDQCNAGGNGNANMTVTKPLCINLKLK